MSRSIPGSGARRRARGFSLIELLIAGAVIAVIGMAGVAYVVRAAQTSENSKDTVYAREKAMSILSELRAYVEGGEGQVAADLDGFDDGISQQAALTRQSLCVRRRSLPHGRVAFQRSMR